jgi:hypothetical protein
VQVALAGCCSTNDFSVSKFYDCTEEIFSSAVEGGSNLAHSQDRNAWIYWLIGREGGLSAASQSGAFPNLSIPPYIG